MALASLGVALAPRLAFAGEQLYIRRSDEKYRVIARDAQGSVNFDNAASTVFFLGADGRHYKCVEPFNHFYDGAFEKSDGTAYLPKSVIHRCACATRYLSGRFSGTAYDVYLQIVIWLILLDTGNLGRVTEAFAADTTHYEVPGYDVYGVYAAFNAWYAENGAAFDGHCDYYWGAASQNVAYFWTTRRVGFASVGKTSSV